MPASIPVRLAPALQFLGRISYDLTVYNVHSRVFSSMDYSRRNVLDTYVIPDLGALDIPLPTFATVCERRKGDVLCHWEVNLLDNVSRSSSMSLVVNVRSQQDTTIRGLTATVEGMYPRVLCCRHGMY